MSQSSYRGHEQEGNGQVQRPEHLSPVGLVKVGSREPSSPWLGPWLPFVPGWGAWGEGLAGGTAMAGRCSGSSAGPVAAPHSQGFSPPGEQVAAGCCPLSHPGYTPRNVHATVAVRMKSRGEEQVPLAWQVKRRVPSVTYWPRPHGLTLVTHQS